MAAPQRTGALVTVEGIDGSGKTSVVDALGRWLEREGVKAAVQREPTTSWLGEAVRRAQIARTAPLGHMFLFLADRAEHVRFMADELKWNTTILCDRYFDSTVAYQGAALEGVVGGQGFDVVDWIRALHQPWVIVPDLTLLIVDDPNACVERLRKHRGHTSMFEDAGYLAKVQEIYKRQAAREPGRFKVLEGGDLEGLIARAQGELETFLATRGLLHAAKKGAA
jgi:dTMP kinase